MKISTLNTILICLALLTGLQLTAQEKSAADAEYTKVITGRADDIVDKMQFDNETVKRQVRDIIVDHYRFLNEAEEVRNAGVEKIREELADQSELRNAKIDLLKADYELKVRDHHFAFLARLTNLLPEAQVNLVKDGLTYGVLEVTYNSYCDMIPGLKDEEKRQILVWLTEAREHAIDGGSSKEKHGWFGKYKGRINNYLSERGYDLQAERDAWEERLKEKEK